VNVYYVMAIWVGMALIAAFFSIKIGVSVALVEILVGAIAGNIPGIREHVQQTDYTTLLAGIGSVLLTFLAGAEIDPVSLKKHWKASLSIGVASFLLPLIGAYCFARYAFHWNFHASEIAGIALSTTSVAVVYAVMVETGLNRQDIGKLILAACFVTDLGTVLALGGLFASYDWLLLVFVVVTTVVLFFLPKILRWVVANLGHRVSEPEVKVIFVVLLALGGLATAAGSEAVLPAYVAGLVVAGVFMNDRVVLDRIRTIAFALLTPFFFLRAGTLISDSALVSGAGIIVTLFFVKMVTKFLGVWPTTRAFGLPKKERTYTTLLMATGLTFGSISALYGLTHHLINESQYTELVTVVILSAFVPTLIAQQFFRPTLVVASEQIEALGEEDISMRHRRSGRAEGGETPESS
jgi:Kef-type K+ transport system membrane component KefB